MPFGVPLEAHKFNAGGRRSHTVAPKECICNDRLNIVSAVAHEVLVEVARPVFCSPTRTTAITQLQRSLEMPEFDTESRESGECVDRESTPIASMVIALVGIWMLLNGTVYADRVE
jgi:hypothetical protein